MLRGRLANNSKPQCKSWSVAFSSAYVTAQRSLVTSHSSSRSINEKYVSPLVIFDAEVNAWWRWWYDRNELYVPDQKPTQYSYQFDGYVIPQTSSQVSVAVQQFSCLVAGMQIQTADGLQPIEAIQPGDLVLAQHAESGELSYKPVLRVTNRPSAARNRNLFSANHR
jgi:hypothetical protein